MDEKIKPEIRKQILDVVNDRLPDNGKILCLSLTGSRAFGWANERMDYDIHGMFVCKNYWDWVCYGEKGLDINLYELEYLFTRLPKYLSFEFFQNISNPIYLNPEFDYYELMSLCAPTLCYEPTREIKALEADFHPRAALHCYRVLMVPIHFLKTRTFELNIFKINEDYKFEMLPLLKWAYLSSIEGRGRAFEDKEEKIIKQDLEKLLKEFRVLKENFRDEKIDTEKLEKWKEKATKIYKG